MKILVVNNFEFLDFELDCKTNLELFYALRSKIYNKIKNLWIVNNDLAFVEFENLENIKTFKSDIDGIVAEEIVGYKLYKKSILYAIQFHGDQKYNKIFPYFYHLKQTDKVVDNFYGDIPKGKFFIIKTASILHDVLEDTTVDFEKLSRDFSNEIADIVLKVTKIDEEDTVEFETNYYKEMAKNPLAIIVKIADKCANTKQTVKNMSVWHANRLIDGHPIFQDYTYLNVEASNLKRYLDNLISIIIKKLGE